MNGEEYARSFDARVAELLPQAAARVPGVAARLRDAGIDPDAGGDAAALDRLPVLTKDELLDLQAGDPPFGGLLAPGASVRRIFQSPGPLYEPELAEPDPWGWAPALEAAGFSAGAVVVNTFSYHLSPAGAMFEAGATALGCTVVPAGVGSFDLQLRACADSGATGYIGLPSYLKALLDKADAAGVRLPLERAFVTAEPLPPSLRAALRERVPVVQQAYGTAEGGNLGYECERMSGLHLPEDRLVEVCGLDDGQPRWDGGEGQVVVSLLRPDYPLLRLGTGDLSAVDAEPCPCGRPTPRLVGWLGRVGEAVKVRGMFLHPRQVRAVMSGVPGVSAYRFVVDRVAHKDVLRAEIVVAAGEDVGSVAGEVGDRVRAGLRFEAEVTPVPGLEPDAGVIADARTWE